MVTIEESEMRFGLYDEESVFYIEHSPQYQKNLQHSGIKSCEFILQCTSDSKITLYLLEAKRSAPIQNLDCYVSDILDKMRHSLLLYANILLNRFPSTGVPPALSAPDLSAKAIRLVLVVKTAKNEWLPPLEDTFQAAFQQIPDFRIWNVDNIYVINESIARTKGFVI